MMREALIGICLFAVALGGCNRPTSTGREMPVLEFTELRTAAAPGAENVAFRQGRAHKIHLGRSTEDRPIEMLIFGAENLTHAGSEEVVLIFAGIHGDEPLGVGLAEQFVKEVLAARPELFESRVVAVIPRANPDGLKKKTRANARGVDLNRNFPAKNFKPSKRFGPEPLSEPESRALKKALDMLRPRRIMSIHSTRSKNFGNNYDGPAGDIAQMLTRQNGYKVLPTWGAPTPGSFGSYAGIDSQLPVITLELPHDATAEEVWSKNRDALTGFVTYEQGK